MSIQYHSKYALSDGIAVVNVEKSDRDTGNCRWYKPHPDTRRNGGHAYVTSARYLHDTLDQAIAAANVEREKKLKSLRKQVARLEAMTFEVKP